MLILYAITAVLLLVSLLASPARTGRALRVAGKRFLRVAPAFVMMLVAVAVVLTLLPKEFVAAALAADNRWVAAAAGLGLGAVTIMPGFVAFPLCGVLREQGALYMVLSAFSTALMMVGFVTFPLERKYLGTKLAVWRNVLALVTAVVVALATGIVFGEL